MNNLYKNLTSLEEKLTVVPCPHAQDDLTDVDTGDGTSGLAIGTTHASLQPIGTSA